jgi:hypothetical protein
MGEVVIFYYSIHWAASIPQRRVLLPGRRQIRAAAVRHFRRHAYALAQRGVRVDGLADVDGVDIDEAAVGLTFAKSRSILTSSAI